jgi:hypothetical protein
MLRTVLIIVIIGLFAGCNALSTLRSSRVSHTRIGLFGGGAPENKPAAKKDGGGLFGGIILQFIGE